MVDGEECRKVEDRRWRVEEGGDLKEAPWALVPQHFSWGERVWWRRGWKSWWCVKERGRLVHRCGYVAHSVLPHNCNYPTRPHRLGAHERQASSIISQDAMQMGGGQVHYVV